MNICTVSYGKGKEYNKYSGKLICEEYHINGYLNGKGKEFDRDSNLKLEGEYLVGNSNGKGKEYKNE